MKTVHTILALDMATSTGWALRDSLGHVTSGVQTFALGRGESAGMRFLRFSRWLDEVARDPLPTSMSLGLKGDNAINREGRPDVIAFERAHHRGGAATEVGVGLMTHLLSFAAHFKIETAPVHTATLKKHATGRGNAKKPDMIAAALARWPHRAQFGKLGDDEADALLILAWALDECGVKDPESGRKAPRIATDNLCSSCGHVQNGPRGALCAGCAQREKPPAAAITNVAGPLPW